MSPAPRPANEAERLAALYRLEVLDTPAEEAFDRVVHLAAAVFAMPTALISLVDRDRQWFKAVHGLGVRETPRDAAFCAHAILRGEVCQVSDAQDDPRFADNPLVTGAPHIRFYAGAPLRTEDGYNIGTLCLIDYVPRPDFGPAQREALARLAALTADEFSLRMRQRELLMLAAAEAEARAEAAEAVAIKAGFIATMAHEIRTPLGGIIGMVEMLNASGLREDQAHFATTLQAAAAHLLRVVNDVLDFSKLEAGALETEPAPCNLTEIVEETIYVLAPAAREAELAIGAVFAPGVPRLVVADSVRLRQVLFNLVGNALKFTNSGGVYVTVRGEEEKADGTAAIHFEIRDTGIGIPEADLPRLFQRFSQLHPTGARRDTGTGLGLAICRHLVRLMGGDIQASSVLGRGSAFSFTLRLQLQPGAPALSPPPLAGQRVLLAESNQVDQFVLRQQMEALGALVTCVDDPAAIGPALTAARRAGSPFGTLILSRQAAAQLEVDAELEAGGQPFGPLRVVRTQAGGSPGAGAVLAKPAGETALLAALRPRLAPAPISAPTPAAQPAPARRLRILLAEDNEINQLVASAMLGSLGHELTIVANGIEAVAAAATGQHDLVLMDMMMPGIDGPTATRAIRKLPGPQAGIYVIALTANAAPEHRALCLAAGMNDFITKPVTRRHLTEALQRYTLWSAAQPLATA